MAKRVNLRGLYSALKRDSIIFFYDNTSTKSQRYRETIDTLSKQLSRYYTTVYIDVNKYRNGIDTTRVGTSTFGQPISDVFFGAKAPVLLLCKQLDDYNDSGFCMRYLPYEMLKREVLCFFKRR